jgi:predicted TIM-barrel fold metal-dependent hydrolase
MDKFWELVRAGSILQDELIVDCHTHLGPYFNFHIPKNDANGMIDAMDSCGIRSAICSPHIGVVSDYQYGNQLVAVVVQRHPSRFYGYCAINPNYSEKAITDELEKYITLGGFRGVKIHPDLHRCAANARQYHPMWAFAQETGTPVLSHTWDAVATSDPLLFGSIAAEFPEVNIILGHSGGAATGIDNAILVAKDHQNIYLDLTCSRFYHGMLEKMVKEIGAERILFGTDSPFLDCRPRVGFVAIARIADDDKRKIFGLNATRVFKL